MDRSGEQLKYYLEAIKDDLDRSIRFWLDHSHDEIHGGFFDCLSANGSVYDKLKHCWLQSRQVWMYSRLYNEVKRFQTPQILTAAKQGGKFLMQNVKRGDGSNRCYFIVTNEGRPVKQQRTLFTECFYLMAMSELARATHNQKYMSEALQMMAKIEHWATVDDSELVGPKLEGAVAVNSLGVPMMVLCVIDQLLTVDEGLAARLKVTSDWAIQRIRSHVQRNGTVVLEHVTDDGKELPGSQGRLTVPGHVIECGWFLLKAGHRNGDKQLMALAMDTFILPTIDSGWDMEHGGLYYFLDVDGWSPTQLEWNMKLWWPHNEAMIALLMAYQFTKDVVYMQKFEQVFHYCYTHFVDKEHGEWFGYLNRDGKVSMTFKGGPFKGCFHVPRALMMCEKMLRELIDEKSTTCTAKH